MSRAIRFKTPLQPCPHCGNTTAFTVHSDRAAEDCCDVYLECTCGHTGDAYEDVWGGTGDDMVMCAASCWDMSVADTPSTLKEPT